jgi:flagellin
MVTGANEQYIGFQLDALIGVNAAQAVTTIDITSRDGANLALLIVDRAIGQISADRAELGAVQNRIDSTISNLSTTVENANAARSRILDADFAAETAALSRNQILQQAGTSILAQANQQPQQVLTLLQGG